MPDDNEPAVTPHEDRLEALDAWVRDHVHNSVVSADEYSVNAIHNAVAQIKAAINRVKE